MTEESQRWSVAEPLAVRATTDIRSPILRLIDCGVTVNGRTEGDWLKLSEEPGYILIRKRDRDCLAVIPAGQDSEASHSGMPKRQKSESSSVSSSAATSSSTIEGGSDNGILDARLRTTREERRAVGHEVLFHSSSSGNRTPNSSSTDDRQAEPGNTRGGVERPRSVHPDALDENGQLLSIGSELHGTLTCKPCLYYPDCIHGQNCRFCHVGDHSEGHATRKARPCKGKRDTYKNLVKRTMDDIQNQPDSFSIDSIRMPPSVSCDKTLREKFISRMKSYHEHIQAQSHRAGEGATARSSGSGALSSVGGTAAASSSKSGTASASVQRPNIVSL